MTTEIKTRPYETAQEYYDALVQAAHDGTFPSAAYCDNKSGKIKCLYYHEGPDGTIHRCSAGILFDDKKLAAGMSGSSGAYWAKLFEALVPNGFSAFELQECQMAHDQSCSTAGRGQPILFDRLKFVNRLNSLPCFASCVKSATRKDG